MPGFGYDPFGTGPFGAWDWSKNVLYKLTPEIYRESDEDQGFVLKKFTYGLRYSFDNLRWKIRHFTELRSPFLARTQYNEVQLLTLGQEIVVQGDLEQRGIDATVNALQEFVSPTGRFRFDDVGKELICSGSTFPANNRRVRIARIISPSRVLTDPQLLTDVTPFKWELRPVVDRDPALRTLQVLEGTVDEITPGWLLSDGLAQYEVVARRHFDWKDPTRQLYTLQEGTDAFFNPSGFLIVGSGSFSASSIGQKILVAEGQDPENLGVWEIEDVLTTSPPWTLSLVESAERIPDTTLYYWGTLPRAELDVQAIDQPRGVAEQSGVEGTVTAGLLFTASFANFDADEVGKLLTIQGSALGNDGLYEITAFTAPNSLTVTPSFVVGESNLTWQLRRPTVVGSTTQVEVAPPSLIQWLAKDFGIEIDVRESESIQRSWVQHVSRWINIKGLPKSYEVVGLLTGLLITTTHLYRVDQEIFLGLIAAGYPGLTVESGESAVGRFGDRGKLEFDGGVVTFIDPEATFFGHDVGRHIRVREAANFSNEKLYTIDQYVSPTQVKFRPVLDGAITPDYGPGGLVSSPDIIWSVVRLYATVAPLQPNMDEFNSDLLDEIVDGSPPTTDNFGIDRFCWETNFSTDVPFDFVSVTLIGDYLWEVVVETPPGQPGSAEVILVVGNWGLYDANGIQYFVETVPVPAGPPDQWRFQVFGTIPPAIVGPEATFFRYDCPTNLHCGYCGSNKILLSVALGPELSAELGLAVENILARAIERVEQAKPAHVEIVQRFVRELTAPLTLSASVEPHPWIFAILYAPLSPYYDDIPGDDLVPDFYLFATLEVIVTP
jgi:hypothetical protein